MPSFRARLESGTVVVGDGGWGTMLAARGLPLGAPPERWTLEHPDVIAEIATAYADAGAELITTNTFGASPIRLEQHHLADRLDELNRRAVAIVRDAVKERAFVSASIGPTGRLLEPLGEARLEDVAAGFERQARALVSAGADLLCIETMTDLEEAVLAVRAARAASADIPIVATMTFEPTPRGAFTVMGVSVPAACAALGAAGADVVGANCGGGAEEGAAVAREFLDSTTLPVAVQPNAGVPTLVKGKLVYPTAPDRFAEILAPLAVAGVRIVGGCCGTTPAHIAALRRALARL
ncbi:MAG TPA: homocysteine S-methyltransferase family protein [Thermoanaerobaculia bacterium]|nr:homocysteine S-methyltransferase family protein [Thermoanaerobaculia bacterium]